MKKIQITRLALLVAVPLNALAAGTVYNNQGVTAPPLDPSEDPHQRGLSLGGPRFGVSYVSGAGFDKMKEAVKKAKPEVELEQATKRGRREKGRPQGWPFFIAAYL